MTIVETGIADNSNIEIKSGVKAGDEVVSGTYAAISRLLKDGSKINWRQDLAKRLLDLQNADGSWVNQSGRWMERDPLLVTTYGVITLEILDHGL